tara:strand:- start:24764 stop:26485 length:1722 start_codon:yes stop_codon:yes gene_type:complete
MNAQEKIKNTGATFTPRKLASFLADEILKHVNIDNFLNVLDPSCGDGELLIAMKSAIESRKGKFALTGFDTSFEYLESARLRLKEEGYYQPNLIQNDFLEVIDINSDQVRLNLVKEYEPSLINNSADVIIANPPYVRTQILGSEKAQYLANKFNLKGRVDLYYPFLIAMTEALKTGGIIGVITSNKYFSTKGGESIRRYLADNYEILEVFDLGDTKLFSAAVLPAILIGRKKSQKERQISETRFTKVYEDFNEYKGSVVKASTIYEILKLSSSGYFQTNDKTYKVTQGILKSGNGNSAAWQMLNEQEAVWCQTIKQNSKNQIKDFFKVRVGIKTTADKVFISENWDELGENKPEESLLKDLISQENIDRWNVNQSVKLKVLYTHFVEDGKKKTIQLNQYPKAEQYFLSHQERLQGRTYVIEAGREWFEIWVPQNPDFWYKPKLVFPDISLKPRFYFDEKSKIVNGNCYWILAENENDVDKLLLIQGIANSNLMTKYHDLNFSNKLYAGRRRYFSQYVEQYPLPNLKSPHSIEIIEVVKELNKTSNECEIKLLENRLEELVARAFGVEPVVNLE